MILPWIGLIMLSTASCSNDTESYDAFYARYGIDKLMGRDADFSFPCHKWPTAACPTAIKSASFALSLLREAASHRESFVLSPYSIGLSLSILHDGAAGNTQEELGELLMKGCAPSDVSSHYSDIVAALSDDVKKCSNKIEIYKYARIKAKMSEEINEDTNEIADVEEGFFTFSRERPHNYTVPTPPSAPVLSATRLYVDASMTLNPSYAELILKQYEAETEQIDFSNKSEAVRKMNDFVEFASKGAFKDLTKEDEISRDTTAVLINVITFRGEWGLPFSRKLEEMPFRGAEGYRNMTFMGNNYAQYYSVNIDNDFGTVLLIPYEVPHYTFFILMPKESMDFETMRKYLTGEMLTNILTNTERKFIHAKIPKFEMETDFNATSVLSKLGVSSLFHDKADFSKMSEQSVKIARVAQRAVIKIDEHGTEASAATRMFTISCSAPIDEPISLTFDRPFLYGIMRNSDILFLGHLV